MWNTGKQTFFSILCLLLIGVSYSATATHIVGGGITYECLGTNSSGFTRYKISIEIFQDCLNGLDVARREDNPAFIGIFSNDGDPGKSRIDSIGRNSGGDTIANIVPPNFRNECVNNPPAVCLRRLRFTKEFLLPPNSSGYKIVYVRCCRNENILNINNPGQVGATYISEIPPTGEVACNSSAYFKNLPPQIICINNPFVYDHSATDPDGDSLSYEFCEAYPGGTTSNPKPLPDPNLPLPISRAGSNPPSYGYNPDFSPQNPMGGNPQIRIDPETGLITGTPDRQGRFVVAVCANEWRNGVLINTITREFQFVVTNCSKAVIADIPQLSDEFNTYIVECETNTVEFINNSRGGSNYLWTFGVDGATSTDFSPTYSYPDTGTYEVTLYVNKGSTCQDSITRLVKVYPEFNSDFTYDGLKCPNASIEFTDLSTSDFKPIDTWKWDFGDGNTSTQRNPVHSYSEGGSYNVRFISGNVKGCRDTVNTTIDVENFQPFAGNDTIIVQGESVYFNAQGGIIYKWEPRDRLTASTIANPVGYYPDTGRYNYSVFIESVNQCTGYDSIEVWVVSQGSLFVPSAFSPNGDGLNDVLKPISVGYKSFEYFRVFNRWGEVVFETNRIGDGWDGNFRGKTADISTYFWMLKAVDKDDNVIDQKGDVTLIR